MASNAAKSRAVISPSVPLPPSAALMLGGLALLAGRAGRWRKR